jgi:hypothetical protein
VVVARDVRSGLIHEHRGLDAESAGMHPEQLAVSELTVSRRVQWRLQREIARLRCSAHARAARQQKLQLQSVDLKGVSAQSDEAVIVKAESAVVIVVVPAVESAADHVVMAEHAQSVEVVAMIARSVNAHHASAIVSTKIGSHDRSVLAAIA